MLNETYLLTIPDSASKLGVINLTSCIGNVFTLSGNGLKSVFLRICFLKRKSDISSNQELLTIIPEVFYDKYRIVFYEYNLDRKIVRIGLYGEQQRAERRANAVEILLSLRTPGTVMEFPERNIVFKNQVDKQ